jgi:hypothetical protein
MKKGEMMFDFTGTKKIAIVTLAGALLAGCFSKPTRTVE